MWSLKRDSNHSAFLLLMAAQFGSYVHTDFQAQKSRLKREDDFAAINNLVSIRN
jgi:hypothetical protein